MRITVTPVSNQMTSGSTGTIQGSRRVVAGNGQKLSAWDVGTVLKETSAVEAVEQYKRHTREFQILHHIRGALIADVQTAVMRVNQTNAICRRSQKVKQKSCIRNSPCSRVFAHVPSTRASLEPSIVQSGCAAQPVVVVYADER